MSTDPAPAPEPPQAATQAPAQTQSAATAAATATPVTIRQAVLADLDALAPLFDLYRCFYGRQTDLAAARAFLRQRFEHGQSVLFIAAHDGAPLGFTQLYPIFSSTSLSREFVLNDLFVLEAGRKRGIGKALLDAAAGYARAAGATGMSLSTAHSNDSAQSLYRANGWEPEDVYRQFNLRLPAE